MEKKLGRNCKELSIFRAFEALIYAGHQVGLAKTQNTRKGGQELDGKAGLLILVSQKC